MRRTSRWRDDGDHRRRDQERLDAHVEQPVAAPTTASVACSDDSTKWPVSADCTAIRAVSTSRISPTRMTSGSWRRIDFSPPAKVMPACSLIWIWLIDREDVLDRVLDRHDVALGAVDLAQRGVQRRRLAAAGRAGADHHAVRRADAARCSARRVSARHAELARAGTAAGSCRAAACTTFSPQTTAVVATRMSTSRPSTVDGDLAVLRAPPLDDVHPAEDLDPADDAPARSSRAASSTSCSAPSIRYRTRTRSSCGSMWMSEARSRSAWVMISCTTWTTGASSLTCALSSRLGLPAQRVARLERLDLGADLAGQRPVAVPDRALHVRCVATAATHRPADRRAQTAATVLGRRVGDRHDDAVVLDR